MVRRTLIYRQSSELLSNVRAPQIFMPSPIKERIALIALPFTGTFRSSCSLLLMFTSGLLT